MHSSRQHAADIETPTPTLKLTLALALTPTAAPAAHLTPAQTNMQAKSHLFFGFCIIKVKLSCIVFPFSSAINARNTQIRHGQGTCLGNSAEQYHVMKRI